MKTNFQIIKNTDSTLSVLGIKSELIDGVQVNYYQDEDVNPSLTEYKYSLSKSIDILFSVSSDEEDTQIDLNVSVHGDIDKSTFTTSTDGLYKVKHIIIPTVEWISSLAGHNMLSQLEESELTNYFIDVDTELIYKVTFENHAVKPIAVDNSILISNLDITNLVYKEEYVFITYNLENCLFNINQYLLNSLCPANCNKSSYDTYIYNRDLVWMGLNIINYLLEQELYFKALSVLGQLENCNGICNQQNKNNGGSGCGCNG